MVKVTKLLGQRRFGTANSLPNTNLARIGRGETAHATTRTDQRDNVSLGYQWTLSDAADNDTVVGTVASMNKAQSSGFEILSGDDAGVFAMSETRAGQVIVDNETILEAGVYSLVIRETLIFSGVTSLSDSTVTITVS